MLGHCRGEGTEQPQHRRIKFVICGNLRFIALMQTIAESLQLSGHQVALPVAVPGTDYRNKSPLQGAENIRKHDLIRKHFDKIKDADAILVVNQHEPGRRRHRIGGNTFLEMGFAHVLGKEIFVLWPLPTNVPYYEEMLGMNPKVLHGRWDRINESDFLKPCVWRVGKTL